MSNVRGLRINGGSASLKGRRDENQDVTGMAIEASGDAIQAVAIADGVSDGPAGATAATIAIHEFLDAMTSLSPTAGVQRNAAIAVASINGWLHAMGLRDAGLRQAATTLTAFVLSGRDAHLVHVGDTRAWLLRDGRLDCLTTDHTRQQREQEHVLLRALGLESSVRADYHVQGLRQHDRLVLSSDGVHATLDPKQLRTLLARRGSPEADALRIVEAAIAAGSRDNASCVVVDVLEVPEASAPELRNRLAALPILSPPRAGEEVDGYEIGECLSDGRYTRLMRARDTVGGADVVLKFPRREVAPDSTQHLAFVREAWVGARLHSPYLGQVLEVPVARQTRLYSVMPYYPGETLEARIGRDPQVGFAEGVVIAQGLLKAIAALHRAGIIHRDIKPENVLLESAGGLRLIDLGAVRLPRLADLPTTDIPGTPSYMAPQLFDGSEGDERSDQFALAVTLYRMWSGAYPYGEIEPFSRPRHAVPAPLAKYRPDLPAWVGDLLAQALQVDPAGRFGDVVELSMAIDNGLSRGEPRNLQPISLYERDPLRFWKVVSALLALALLVTFALNA